MNQALVCREIRLIIVCSIQTCIYIYRFVLNSWSLPHFLIASLKGNRLPWNFLMSPWKQVLKKQEKPQQGADTGPEKHIWTFIHLLFAEAKLLNVTLSSWTGLPSARTSTLVKQCWIILIDEKQKKAADKEDKLWNDVSMCRKLSNHSTSGPE